MVGFLRRVFGKRGKAAHTGRHRTQGCSGRFGHFIHITETGWRCCRCPRTFDAGTREPKSTGPCACSVVEQQKFVGRNPRDDVTAFVDDLWLPEEETVVVGGGRVRRQLAAAGRGGRWSGRANAA